MSFIHFTVKAGPDNIIQVSLSREANVRLMDSVNYQKYRLKKKYSFIGGMAMTPVFDLRPKNKGEWHVIVDLEGLEGEVRASVEVLH